MQDFIKRQTRFVSREPAKVVISSVEAVAESMGLKVNTRNFKVSNKFKNNNNNPHFYNRLFLIFLIFFL